MKNLLTPAFLKIGAIPLKSVSDPSFPSKYWSFFLDVAIGVKPFESEHVHFICF